MPTILITGFGPFPGAPFNPTVALVQRLVRLRRPALADVTIVGHVFDTSYAAVDRDLPTLIEKYRPDALLMFELAARTRYNSNEKRAPNPVALLLDLSAAVLTSTYLNFGTERDYVFCVESEFQFEGESSNLKGHFLLLPDLASLRAIFDAIRVG